MLEQPCTRKCNNFSPSDRVSLHIFGLLGLKMRPSLTTWSKKFRRHGDGADLYKLQQLQHKVNEEGSKMSEKIPPPR